MKDPFILNLVQRTLQATVDVMPTTFTLDPDYDRIEFEEGYEKPPRDVFYAKYNYLLNESKYKELRKERNKRLAESDYMMLPDVPQENLEAWKVYRQALRDLPSGTEDPDNPVWPVPPP